MREVFTLIREPQKLIATKHHTIPVHISNRKLLLSNLRSIGYATKQPLHSHSHSHCLFFSFLLYSLHKQIHIIIYKTRKRIFIFIFHSLINPEKLLKSFKFLFQEKIENPLPLFKILMQSNKGKIKWLLYRFWTTLFTLLFPFSSRIFLENLISGGKFST